MTRREEIGRERRERGVACARLHGMRKWGQVKGHGEMGIARKREERRQIVEGLRSIYNKYNSIIR